MTESDLWQKNVCVGQYASLLNGFAFPSEGFADNDGTPLIRIRDLRSQTTKINFRGSFDAKYIVRRGDLLIGMDGDFDTVKWKGDDALLNQRVCKLETKDSDKLVQDFLFYRIIEEVLHINRITAATTVKHLSSQDVLGITIDLPSKLEQTKIAEILSLVDHAIEQTEVLIGKQQRIKTGLTQDLLTKGIDEHGNIRSEATHAFKDSPLGRIPVEWNVRQLGSVFTMQLGKMLSKKAIEGKSPFPYLGNKNVQWDCVDLTELLEMDFTEQERKKFELLVDDILVCEGGEVGRTALWRGELDGCYFQKAIHRLRPVANQYLPRLFPRFMRHAISTGALMNFTSQTSIAHLTQERLASLPILVPEIEEQSRIVQVFDILDESIHLENVRLKKMSSLKVGLMHDLLTGKRRITPLLTQAPAP